MNEVGRSGVVDGGGGGNISLVGDEDDCAGFPCSHCDGMAVIIILDRVSGGVRHPLLQLL